ncbi:MAG: Flagella basal body P-ring formation protein FlgA [Candidatus Erwinia impunctatus]|nr:Flagella basal body P-ring formation protein FlgA [Culicoides impunctatus]
MHYQGTLLILVLALFNAGCQAADGALATAITHYFQTKYRDSGRVTPEINVTIKTPETQWPDCDTPELSLPGNGRLMGNVSIAATCNKLRRYLQVEVQVVAEYLVAARPITRGTMLTSDDIKQQRGRIDKLPVQLLREP